MEKLEYALVGVLVALAAALMLLLSMEEESCNGLRMSEAREIIEGSECAEFPLTGKGFCNEDTQTWWLDLDTDSYGCAPACVVNTETKEAVINYRCMGVITD